MIIETKKIERSSWSMELCYETEERMTDSGQYLNPHDHRIELICKELSAWEGVLYSRKSYSTWHWYDQTEMEHFITYFTLKHSGK